MIPPELFEELITLQDRVAPLPFEVIGPTIEKYCGPVDEAFQSLERAPLAAASVSQVHRAVLHDGTEVAVGDQPLPPGDALEYLEIDGFHRDGHGIAVVEGEGDRGPDLCKRGALHRDVLDGDLRGSHGIL